MVPGWDQIVVSGPVAQEKPSIWIISVIGATLKKMRDDAYDASLSHDGSQIVFRDSVTRDIWLMNADGGSAKALSQARSGLPSVLAHMVPQRQTDPVREVSDRNGETTLAIGEPGSPRRRSGHALSNPQLTDFCFGTERAADLLCPEAAPNDYDSNLWELRFDERRKAKRDSAASYRLDRILFWQSAIDCGWKTFRLS